MNKESEENLRKSYQHLFMQHKELQKGTDELLEKYNNLQRDNHQLALSFHQVCRDFNDAECKLTEESYTKDRVYQTNLEIKENNYNSAVKNNTFLFRMNIILTVLLLGVVVVGVNVIF